VLLLKHGVLAETETAHVHATDVIDTKVHKADIIILEQFQQCPGVSIQSVQVEFIRVVALNVTAVKDVLAMLMDLT
jgi:hypothetical protein